MVFDRGRLLDHVHLRVSDLEASKAFYAAALGAVGRGINIEGPGFFAADELFVSADGESTTGLHLAFQAVDRETVHPRPRRQQRRGRLPRADQALRGIRRGRARLTRRPRASAWRRAVRRQPR